MSRHKLYDVAIYQVEGNLRNVYLIFHIYNMSEPIIDIFVIFVLDLVSLFQTHKD